MPALDFRQPFMGVAQLWLSVAGCEAICYQWTKHMTQGSQRTSPDICQVFGQTIWTGLASVSSLRSEV